MVGEHPGDALQLGGLGDDAPQLGRAPGRVQELEGEGEVEVLEVARQHRARQIDLADQQRLARRLAQGAEREPDLRVVAGVDRVERRLLGVERQRRLGGGGRVVAELGVLHDPLDRVDAEAGDAAVEPEADHLGEGGPDLGVAPVEVGLLGEEGVQVVAPAALVEAPGGPAEARAPVVRRLIRPHVPVGVLAEPGVLDRGVGGDEVHQQADVRGRGTQPPAGRSPRSRRRPGRSPCSR